MPRSNREYIYGINPAFEVVRAGRRTVYRAFLNQSTAGQPRMQKLADLLGRHEIAIDLVERGRLTDLSQSREHQGVVLKTGLYPYTATEDLWDADRLLLLDNIEDPHNVGAILRSAEIFGFHAVLLSKRGVPEVYPSVVKVSAGATEFLRISKEYSANQYAQAAREKEYRIVALDAKGDCDLRPAAAESAGQRLLLVIGGEDKSVGQYILNMADRVARIEQRGRINSLNASVAASIAMFAFAGHE